MVNIACIGSSSAGISSKVIYSIHGGMDYYDNSSLKWMRDTKIDAIEFYFLRRNFQFNRKQNKREQINSTEEMEEGGSRRGYVPVLVGEREEDTEKIWVTIKAIQHLTIVELLDQSANEYGYQDGLLKIAYDADKFKAILHNISKK